MQELQAHYDGTPEGALQKQVSRKYPKKTFYKIGTTFKFEKHVTKLKGILNVLEKYDVLIYEEQMVEHIIDQIMSPNTYLNTEVTICRSSHFSIFVKSSTYLSTVGSILYPSTNPSSRRFRNRNIYVNGHGDCDIGSGGRFCGRDIRRRLGGRGG